MASSIRFSGVSKSDGSELFCIEPEWWVGSELGLNVSFKWSTSDDTGSYSDSDADISIDEARILHNQFRPKLKKLIAYNTKCLKSYMKDTGPYAAQLTEEYAEYVAELQSHLMALDSVVGSDSEKYSHFHVRICEWESGL